MSHDLKELTSQEIELSEGRDFAICVVIAIVTLEIAATLWLSVEVISKWLLR